MIDDSASVVIASRLQTPYDDEIRPIKDISSVSAKTSLALKAQQENRRRLLIGLYGLVFLVVFAIYTVADKIETRRSIHHVVESPQTSQAKIIDSNALSAVESAIRPKFLGGSWRYQGAEVKNNQVHVFIQIPEQLESEIALQKRYIKHSLCPKSSSNVWQLASPQQVILHLFVNKKEKHVAANCA